MNPVDLTPASEKVWKVLAYGEQNEVDLEVNADLSRGQLLNGLRELTRDGVVQCRFVAGQKKWKRVSSEF